MSKRFLFLLVVSAALLSACTGTATPVSMAQDPVEGIPESNISLNAVVPTGSPIIRDLGTTEETVWNCGPGTTITKNPYASITSNYAVEWEVGGKTGIGLIIGGGELPVEVNLSAALEGHYAQSISEEVTHGTGWNLPAEPGTIIIYTLQWYEMWQPGYIDVVIRGDTPFRVNVLYRIGFQSEIINKEFPDCPDDIPPGQPSPENNIQPAATPLALSTQVSVTLVPQSTPSPVSIPTSVPQGTIVDDINRLVGEGNWHCLAGWPTGISVRQIPSGFTVQSPFIQVDSRTGVYKPGQTVPQGQPGTGWLSQRLPNNPCSTDRPYISRDKLNSMLGEGNWTCLPGFQNGIIVYSMPQNFIVESPIITVDIQSGVYWPGEAVPAGGGATVWLQSNFSECP